MYKTSNAWLFKSDETRWAPRWTYWVMLLSAMMFTFSIILSWLGIGLFAYLIVSAFISRSNWRRYVEDLKTNAQTTAMERMAAAMEANKQ